MPATESAAISFHLKTPTHFAMPNSGHLKTNVAVDRQAAPSGQVSRVWMSAGYKMLIAGCNLWWNQGNRLPPGVKYLRGPPARMRESSKTEIGL
jgi:hypothetical protein